MVADAKPDRSPSPATGGETDADTEPRVIVRHGGAELAAPVPGRLFVGRECSGVDPAQRLLIDDDEVSRNHLEVRLDRGGRRASLIDTSSNGTWLNGARIERGAPVPLGNGDRIRLGSTELEFQGLESRDPSSTDHAQTTVRRAVSTEMSIAVGDVVGFSAISEIADTNALSTSMGRLFGELRGLLRSQHGSVGNYAGDALFALWELDHFEDAADRAFRFALEAAALVDELAPELSLRDPSGEALRMGWGVVIGRGSTASIGGVASTVLGDSTNLAFRLSALAGREGRPEILATEAILDALTVPYERDEGSEIQVKGRAGKETVFGIRR